MSCDHQWMRRGVPADQWRECHLCQAVEAVLRLLALGERVAA